MRTYLIAIAMMIACQSTIAQNTQDLFEEFGKEYNAETVSISPFLMSIGRLFMDNDTPTIAKRIKSMKVLDLEDCTDSVKARFAERANKLQLERYEPMLQVNEDGEKVRIFARPNKKGIKELLFICTGNENCTLIQMKGNIRKEDIAELVNEQTSKKDGRK